MLNIYALIIILITSLVFYRKDRQKKIEDETYAKLLIVTIFVSISGIILGIIINPELHMDEIIVALVNKIYLICLSLWIMFLTFYTLCISVIKEEKIKKSKIILFVIILFNITMILILPITVVINNQSVTSLGLSVFYTYIVFGLGFILQLICIITDIKNIKSKKYIPIYLLVFFGIVILIFQMLFPNLNYLINPAIILITFIMYHTIENPDVKMVQQMTLAKDMAEKANRAKSDFLSSMSHEIRTPLNAIVGLSEDVLNYKDQVPEEVALDVTDIQNASQTLLEIVGNILDINKIESEKMEIINKPYNLKEEIISLCKVTTTRIKDKPIEFKLDIAPDVPEELIGDKIHIKQVVNNLLSNAIKYTEQGNITLSVKCINEKDICKLIISVQDTGRGIKAENINKLFTKFERLDVEMNSTTEGTGLGLAITKSLVEMMGGKINVQSQFGKGSIFIVYLPQKISKHQSEKIDINELPIENQKDLSGKKILIVDDNKLNIKVAIKALQDFNFAIEECHDGLECLEKVKEKEYDLILMDIMMPVMSGESALAKLKENPEFKTPVIALTADAVSGAREKYIKEGFVDYISKPFNKEQVKEKIEKIFIKKEEEINKLPMVTYVYDSKTHEEYTVKDGQRNDLNNQP